MKQITKFQTRVYEVVARIPRGRVSTYKLVAERLRCGSARAVGQALRRNPFAPRVPCHRIIASDLTVGGFGGARTGPEIVRKLRLLAQEGVRFDGEGKLVDGRLVWKFTARRIDRRMALC